ncbi:hypothetical protein LCGC14_0386200 [marine sediment metagenome]|uniref:YopX protein domain-containing protein n=1 Tax=marine sediment metagenome TaxID=412755 RepID=A0A0F9VN26_9ZZZZ
MNKVKFLAWDKKQNQMCQVLILDMVDGENSLIQPLRPDPNYSTDFSMEPYWESKEFLELRQYIGLKSKHEVDIYEGDMVLHPAYPDPFTIKFINASFGACEKGENFILDTIAPQICEIIGNIYEDPELLGEKES